MIKKWGGMILVNVHPDYINFKNNYGNNEYPVSLYEEFLSYMKNIGVWNPLPVEIANYWNENFGIKRH